MTVVTALSGWQEDALRGGAERLQSCRWPLGNPRAWCSRSSPGPLPKHPGWCRRRKQDGMGHGAILHISHSDSTRPPTLPFFGHYFKDAVKTTAVWLVLTSFSVCCCAGLGLFSYCLEAVQPFLCSVRLRLINLGWSQLPKHRTELVLLFSACLRRFGITVQGSSVGSLKDCPKFTRTWADRCWLWEMCLRFYFPLFSSFMGFFLISGT